MLYFHSVVLVIGVCELPAWQISTMELQIASANILCVCVYVCVCVKLMEYLKCATILQTASSHHGSSFFIITSSDVLIGHMA